MPPTPLAPVLSFFKDPAEPVLMDLNDLFVFPVPVGRIPADPEDRLEVVLRPVGTEGRAAAPNKVDVEVNPTPSKPSNSSNSSILGNWVLNSDTEYR